MSPAGNQGTFAFARRFVTHELACRCQVKNFALLIQEKAAQASMASPGQMARQLDQERTAQKKKVPEFVKKLLKERVQEKGTGNAAKGRRHKKQQCATTTTEAANA